MKTKITTILSASILALAFSTQASATTVTISTDGQWNLFDVDNTLSTSATGLEWIDAQSATGYNNDFSTLDFKFDLTAPAYLTVVDGGFSGDQFKVLDNGNLLGYTSTPVNNYTNDIGTNFDAALLDNHYSSNVFYLTAGSHDITGLLSISAVDASNTAINATVGAVSLTSAVPLPQGFALFLTGFGLLAASLRRRAQTLLG